LLLRALPDITIHATQKSDNKKLRTLVHLRFETHALSICLHILEIKPMTQGV
jgi:riboflavin synthase